jgi:hypothetical protein
MRRDSKLVCFLEYLIGSVFLAVVLPFIVHPQPGWSDAHSWACLIFTACIGITFIGLASGARQRIELAGRIEKLEKQLEEQKHPQSQTHNTSGPQLISREHLVGSVN